MAAQDREFRHYTVPASLRYHKSCPIASNGRMGTTPTVGDRPPELIYSTAAGETHRLSELWAQGPAVVLWLRHFG